MNLKFRLFCFALFFAPAAFAQGVRYDNIAFATRGVPFPNPTVTVCTSAGSGQPCTPLATVYTNATLTTPAASPLPAVAIGQVSTGAGVDAAGNYGFWAPPGRYVLTISGSGVLTPVTMTVTLPCDSTVTSCSLGQISSQIISTVAPGTAPFSIASTTVVPNLNAQLHNGKTAPTGNIVGDTDTQSLSSKTFDISANTFKNSSNTAGHLPRNNGTQYVDAQLGAADLSNGVTGSGAVALATNPAVSGLNMLSSNIVTGTLTLSANTSGIGGSGVAWSGTIPTINAGFGTGASITQPNDSIAFFVNVGTGGTATSGTINLGAVSNGWILFCEDTTTFSTTVFRTRQTGTTTTTATIGNFNSSAASAAWASGDVLGCIAVGH